MKRLATIGDNCVDIYPHLGKAFSGGNAVNVAVTAPVTACSLAV